jgi:hypothetical protein
MYLIGAGARRRGRPPQCGDDLAGIVFDLKEQNKKLASRVSDLEDAVDHLKTRIGTLETQIGKLSGNLATWAGDSVTVPPMG